MHDSLRALHTRIALFHKITWPAVLPVTRGSGSAARGMLYALHAILRTLCRLAHLIQPADHIADRPACGLVGVGDRLARVIQCKLKPFDRGLRLEPFRCNTAIGSNHLVGHGLPGLGNAQGRLLAVFLQTVKRCARLVCHALEFGARGQTQIGVSLINQRRRSRCVLRRTRQLPLDLVNFLQLAACRIQIATRNQLVILSPQLLDGLCCQSVCLCLGFGILSRLGCRLARRFNTRSNGFD